MSPNIQLAVCAVAEYQETSYLSLLHILVGRFCNNCLPAKTPQYCILATVQISQLHQVSGSLC